jgi:hypothetical protein
MKRIRSTLHFAVPLALLLSTTMSPAPAFAENWKDIFSSVDKNGTITIWSQDQDEKSHFYIWKYYADGTIKGYDKYETVYPGPEDTTQATDKPDVAGAIKKGLISYEVHVNPENTPLGQWMHRQGLGATPYWNPGDQEGGKGSGRPPKGGDPNGEPGGKDLTPAQQAALAEHINLIAKQLAAIGNSMGDGFEALGGESKPTPNKHGSGHGKGSGDGSGNSDNKYKNRGGGEAATLGPRPDLVNPPWGYKTGGSGNPLFSRGLLDPKPGSPDFYPAPTGSPNRGGGLR